MLTNSKGRWTMDMSRREAPGEAPACVMCGSNRVSGRIVFAEARRRSGQRFAWFCRSCDAVWTEPIDVAGNGDDFLQE